MPEIVERPIREIIPDAHPHVLLHYFKEPSDGLGIREATAKLHRRIAISSDIELAHVADKITDFLVQGVTISERLELSERCLSEMKVIRNKESHIPQLRR